MSAELTEGGLRTGLTLATGWVEPGRAVGVPRPVDASPLSGVWIELTDDADAPVGGARPYIASSVSLAATEVGLSSVASTIVVPPPRPADRAAWIDRAARAIELEDPPEAAWLELDLTARGLCTPRRWRVIAPATAELSLPDAPVPDVFDAPLVEARVDVVSQQGASAEALWRSGAGGHLLPRLIVERRRATVDGFWRTERADCPPHPHRGRYAFAAPGDACDEAAPARQAVISRCGAFAVLDDRPAPDRCGALVDGAFVGPDGVEQPLSVDEDALAWPVPGGEMRLHAVPQPSASPPADRVGGWPRWTLTEQPLDRDGRPVADPLVVGSGVGVAGSALWLDVDGRLAVRTPRWAFDAVLLSADPDQAEAAIITGGCGGRTERVSIDWSGGEVRIVGVGPDGAGLRRRTLVVSR